MASPSGSPRRGRTLTLNGIPYDTHPLRVLELLQALAGRLQRASTTRSSPSGPSMVHSLGTQQPQQQRDQQQQQQRQQQLNANESISIPGCPCHSQQPYSVKAEFSTREAASKARDLLIAQPPFDQPPVDHSSPHSHRSYHHFGINFNGVEILHNFVLEEEDTLLDIPAIIPTTGSSSSPSTTSGCGCGGCGVCGVGSGVGSGVVIPSPRSEGIHGRRTSAEGIDPTRKHHLLCSARVHHHYVCPSPTH
jgi:hypothetical protein